MPLQADKKKLLQSLALIGFVLVLSQLAGYHMAVGGKDKTAGRKVKVLSESQAQRLAGGRGSSKDSQPWVGVAGVVLHVKSQGDEAGTRPVIVELDLQGATEAAKRLQQMCIFNKLQGLKLSMSTEAFRGIEFRAPTGPQSARTATAPTRAGDLLAGPGGKLVFLTDTNASLGAVNGWSVVGHVHQGLDMLLQSMQSCGTAEIQDCVES
mmetsp:Transcript_5067/g.12768  ORF Transcript_5067/g.12768 Transcript_5067/m.12768 type:complete len:209 (+) Transcript_5067:242-868(+)